MDIVNKNQSAFPSSVDTTTGLSKREMLAAMAMQGLLSVNDKGYIESMEKAFQVVAEYAVKCADALLAELSKPQP